MATAYKANTLANVPPTGMPNVALFPIYFRYAMTAAFVINDTLALLTIPGKSGVLFHGWYLDIPALDSSTGSAIQLGDGTTADRFLAAVAAGQSGAGSIITNSSGVKGVLPVSFSTADVTLTLTISTAPSGTATTSGTIKGYGLFSPIGAATGL